MSLEEKFTDSVCTLYNKEMFFIEGCDKNTSKYNPSTQLTELQLKIFLKKNNLIDLFCTGEPVPYCNAEGSKRKMGKNMLQEVKPLEITINNNNINIEDDTWESFQL